jgi:hypothetical protein
MNIVLMNMRKGMITSAANKSMIAPFSEVNKFFMEFILRLVECSHASLGIPFLSNRPFN